MEIAYRIARAAALTQVFTKNARKNKYFRAIRGVSFDVYRGEIVGLIGKNGSGKSTLLRAIAGIYACDQGQIELYNHTVGLMAIGVGFFFIRY